MAAAAKLPSVTGAPLDFRAASVTIPAGGKSGAAAPSIFYQISGSTVVPAAGGDKLAGFFAAQPRISES
jgi:hypothetical protein